MAECNRLDSVISDPGAGKGGVDKVASDAAGATAGENFAHLIADSVYSCHQYMPLLEALRMLMSLAALARLNERPQARIKV